MMAEVLSHFSAPPTLHLFDTFSGMPNNSIPDRDYHKPSDFADTSLPAVQERLAEHSSLCAFHCGFMPDTFSEVAKIEQYSLVHVDVDIYPSAIACCEFFWPRLAHGGAMIFDDYGFYPYRFAIHAAVNEFFSKQNEPVIVLPTGQALVIRT
jgi:O-methyltransferase